MKSLNTFLLSLIVLLGCNLEHKKEKGHAYEIEQGIEIEEPILIPHSRPKGNSDFYLKEDSINISIDEDEYYSYYKGDYNDAIDSHPELYDYQTPTNPDALYKLMGKYDGMFQSEIGKDYYYVLYSHILKKKNGDFKLKKQRERLIRMYRTINSIFQYFNI